MYLICRSRSVDLVDLESSNVIQTFNTELMEPRSLKLLLPTRGAPQHQLPPLSLCYISGKTGDLVIQTFHRADEAEQMHHPKDHAPEAPRQPWDEEKEVKKRIENPGRWEILPNGGIVGVRRVPVASLSSSRRRSFQAMSSGVGGLGSGLRRRGAGAGNSTADATDTTTPDIGTTIWEAWAFNNLESAKTKGIETQPLDQQEQQDNEEEEQHTSMYDNLLVSELGPMVRLGTASVAVGLGNVIKVISVGHEHFDKVVTRDRLTAENLRNQNFVRRRKTGVAAHRARGGLMGGGAPAGVGAGAGI